MCGPRAVLPVCCKFEVPLQDVSGELYSIYAEQSPSTVFTSKSVLAFDFFFSFFFFFFFFYKASLRASCIISFWCILGAYDPSI